MGGGFQEDVSECESAIRTTQAMSIASQCVDTPEGGFQEEVLECASASASQYVDTPAEGGVQEEVAELTASQFLLVEQCAFKWNKEGEKPIFGIPKTKY